MALLEDGNAITFGELWDQLSRLAAAYQAKGVQPGMRILILLPMSVQLYRSVLAILYLGAVAVFLDQWSSLSRIRESMRLVDCSAAIYAPKFRLMAMLLPECRKIPLRLKPRYTSEGKTPQTKMFESLAHHAALITFTTGSTGIPKAADRTHGFLDAQLGALTPLLAPEIELVDMTLLPIVLLLNLAIGRTSVIPEINFRKPAKFKPHRFLEQLNRHNVSSITGSPYYLLELAKYLKQTGHRHSIRRIIIGGAPVFPLDAKVLIEGFNPPNQTTSTEIIIVYGSTEAEPISHLSAKQLLSTIGEQTSRGLAVGTVDQHTTVAIVPFQPDSWPIQDETSFSESCLPEGEVGEIVVTGNHVLTRYYKNEEALRQNKIYVGNKVWHRTGDAGSIKNGELQLFGRCTQVIHWDGQARYPFVLAAEVNQLKDVVHSALVQKSGRLYLVYQGNKHAKKDLQRWLESKQLKDVKIIKISSMPLDPRHFGKVDHERLLLKIKQ